jgi:hypothetical protein
MQHALKQRQPVQRVVVASDSKTVRNALRTYSKLLLNQVNTRTLTRTPSNETSKFEDANRFAKSPFADGAVYLDLKLSENELAEGLARDAVRRMQQMRKEMDLKVDAYVNAYIFAPTAKALKMLKGKRSYIAGEVRAKKLVVKAKKEAVKAPYYTKTWQINGEAYEFGLSALAKPKRKVS